MDMRLSLAYETFARRPQKRGVFLFEIGTF
ncbi:hypothetical protein T260_15875 [Geobacillus thermopakistaniensis]|uniref:Uncharacterized protein n=2 Tax=Geobacillus TaxID=129337 RepID=A0A7U9J8R8_GEOTM|nr:hypothetical protein GA8_16585 [Geobacillus sp. A8]ESU71014.1 hypothetical protein T260_15875 [Geobacillus sp. MAS1]